MNFQAVLPARAVIVLRSYAMISYLMTHDCMSACHVPNMFLVCCCLPCLMFLCAYCTLLAACIPNVLAKWLLAPLIDPEWAPHSCVLCGPPTLAKCARYQTAQSFGKRLLFDYVWLFAGWLYTHMLLVMCPCLMAICIVVICQIYPNLVCWCFLGTQPCNYTYTICNIYIYININTLWLFNIAMENGPFRDGLPGFTY